MNAAKLMIDQAANAGRSQLFFVDDEKVHRKLKRQFKNANKEARFELIWNEFQKAYTVWKVRDS